MAERKPGLRLDTCGECEITCIHSGKDAPGCGHWAQSAIIAAGKADALAQYEADVMRTARKDLSPVDLVTEAAIGAASEAGEIAGLIKKHRYQGHELSREKLLEESGDALYYITLGLKMQGFTLAEAMSYNIAKRKLYYPNGFDPDVSRGREK